MICTLTRRSRLNRTHCRIKTFRFPVCGTLLFQSSGLHGQLPLMLNSIISLLVTNSFNT
uniref:Uncharacterized protein n=1 Tax=Arundo donax TaxID=35708 RepID=A0A0A9AA25_ARUDO